MLNHLVRSRAVVLQDVVLVRARRFDELLGDGLSFISLRVFV